MSCCTASAIGGRRVLARDGRAAAAPRFRDEDQMRPLIAGNWKMNGLVAQLDVIERVAASAAAAPPLADLLICPPATLIGQAVYAAAGRTAIGGQDCASQAAGAFTGDTSAEMLKDAGATAVIVGHSELRQHHGETDAVVATKAAASWRSKWRRPSARRLGRCECRHLRPGTTQPPAVRPPTTALPHHRGAGPRNRPGKRQSAGEGVPGAHTRRGPLQ